jgi:hypothetical protein
MARRITGTVWTISAPHVIAFPSDANSRLLAIKNYRARMGKHDAARQARRSAAKLLARGRESLSSNIAKLPELLGAYDASAKLGDDR